MATGSNYRNLLHMRGRPVPQVRNELRCTLSGPKILDESGNQLVLRGADFGHGELQTVADILILVAITGCNAVRINVRGWGTWGGVIADSYDASSTIDGLVNIPYFENIVALVNACWAVGLRVIIAPDSNCGQAERVGDTTCALGTGSPQTFWTAAGQVRLQLALKAVTSYAKRLRGKVFAWEQVVEPGPTTTIPAGEGTSFRKEDVWSVQDMFRRAVKLGDPRAMFIAGPAPFYQSAQLSGWFNPAWAAENNTIYTCNLLSNASSDTFANVAAKVQILADFRATNNCPVFCQQVGTQAGDDPSPYPLEAQVLGLLNAPNDGSPSIGWSKWEMVSPGTAEVAGSYGWILQQGIGGPRVTLTPRLTVFQNACAATRKLYP